MRKNTAAFVLLCTLLSAQLAVAQSTVTSVDLNEYYRFPFSIGFEYQSLTPFAVLNVPYSIFDLSGMASMPLPGTPELQPFVKAGYLRFNSLDTQYPGKWDSFQLYGALGLAYVTRVAKNFEIGADATVGVSDAIFPNVISDGPVQSPYLLFGGGGKVSLNPSYSFSLDFHPNVRYLMSLGPYNGLDGFLLSLGLSASFRFGEDPDSARAVIRSLRMERADIPPAFSSMQSFYANNPIGRVAITNTEKQPVTDVDISFNQKEYMDSPTPSASVSRIDAGKTLEIPLKAVFNSKVYELEGGLGYTPLSGDIIVSYKLGGRSAEQHFPVTYNLYDKRAMTWDDDRKAAAFITPLDRALKNYTAFVSETNKMTVLPSWNKSLQVGMQVYDALREIGIYYQEDPAAPFTRMQGDKTLVDFISMPRDTLTRRYGDCKNLTVLFCSLLETKNVHTGFITVPGHIYPVFDTGQTAADYKEIHPDRTMTIAVDGTLWVPVEVTMLDGRSDFLAAWQRAIEEWKAFEKERAFYRTADAQVVYSPVAIQQTDLGLQYGSAASIANLFTRDVDAIANQVIAGYASDAQKSGSKKDYNKLGIVAARLNHLREAEDAFSNALKADPKYMSALVNLGNVSYLRGDYAKAISSYRSALPLLGVPDKGTAGARTAVALLVNASRAYQALQRDKESESSLAQANSIDPDEVRRLAEVAPPGTGAGGARAAGSSAIPAVEYVEEER